MTQGNDNETNSLILTIGHVQNWRHLTKKKEDLKPSEIFGEEGKKNVRVEFDTGRKERWTENWDRISMQVRHSRFLVFIMSFGWRNVLFSSGED